MRLCRFKENGLGLVRDDRMIDVTSALDRLPSYRYPLPRYDALIANLDMLREAIELEAHGRSGIPCADVALASPIRNQTNCCRAGQLQEASGRGAEGSRITQPEPCCRDSASRLVLKATSSLIGTSEPIAIRQQDRRTDHEIELAVVIGKKADRVSRDRALESVAGDCIGLDITVRGPEERSMRKSINTYTVLGPWLVTADELVDPSQLALELSVNGQPRQTANTVI